MKLWNERVDLDSSDFLITKDRNYTFHEIFTDSDRIFSETSREIVLILCDKNIETIKSYIGALRNNLVPLLIESETKQDSLLNILLAYKPKYVVLPLDIEIEKIYKTSDQYSTFDSYAMYEFQEKSKDIHPNLGLLLLTSGSTGDPKSVRISKKNIDIATENITKYLKLDETRTSLSLLPFHYSYGLSVLNNAIYTRSSLHLTKKTVLDKTLWDDCIQFNITDISAVPFILEILMRLKLPDLLYKNLRCLTQAGGRLEPKITEYFLNISKQKSFDYFTMYGQTEAAPRISYVPPKDGIIKLGSVGRPLDCGEVFIDTIGNKKGEGELVYVGENVCLGYATTEKDLSKDDELHGVLNTGDIALIDDDGFISIVGRKKRFIKLKGISVNLDYIESQINASSIKCLLIGKDDRLIIVLEKNAKCIYTEDIKNIIKNNFNFHLSLVSIVEDELSKLSSGKPDYKKLMDKFL